MALVAAFAVAAIAAGCNGSDDKNDDVPPVADYEALPQPPASDVRELPNIVFIYSDDQDAATFNPRLMPRTTALIADPGTTFSDFVVATPICCPSRVTYLTGQYPHNSGVFSNKHGYQNMHDQDSTLATWLHDAGYETAWVGKYLQGYEDEKNPKRPAPGYDEWRVTLQPKYFDYKLIRNGEKVEYGSDPADYHTDVITREAVDVVRRDAGGQRPLYMTVNYLAPHKGDGGTGRCARTAAPAPADQGAFEDVPLPRPPSFDRESADQPLAGEPLTPADVRDLENRYRCRIESLQAMDRGIADIVDAITDAGELGRTVFVFTSDNGLLLGQHNQRGKGIPYEEGLRVPFAIRVPERYLDGGASVAEVDRLAANVDLAPTLLDLAEASPCRGDGSACRALDGVSLSPAIGGDAGPPREREVLIEGGDGDEDCTYRGVRTSSHAYLQLVQPGDDGGCEPADIPELYDLRADPFQLENLAAADEGAAVAERLAARLAVLERCAGTRGDRAEAETPPCD